MLNKKNRFSALSVDTGRDNELNIATREFFAKKISGVKLVRHKAESANLKAQYRKVFELSLIGALGLTIVLAQVARTFSFGVQKMENVDIQIQVADIPPTEQFKRPPPPPRPAVPLPTESEDIPDDLTIASTNIDLSDLPPPPKMPDDDEVSMFIPYDEPPQIIGGMAALARHLRYPKIAQSSGVEGTVFVKVLVGTDGNTLKAEVIRAKPQNMGFEEAAMEALKKVKWHPAKQRERDIKVWVSIPVQFKLVS